MAEIDKSWRDNVPGKWYVDENCILCGVCIDVAPGFFKESEAEDHAVVYKQPLTDKDEDLCTDAKDQCPVESIGNDRT